MHADRIKRRIEHYREQEKESDSVQEKRDIRCIIIGLQEAFNITADTPSKYFRNLELEVMRCGGGGRYYKAKDGER